MIESSNPDRTIDKASINEVINYFHFLHFIFYHRKVVNVIDDIRKAHNTNNNDNKLIFKV